MKLKSIVVLATALLMQACASVPTLQDVKSTLNVYPDNRIGYVLRIPGATGYLRAWTTSQDEILALRFKEKIINTKDIESVESFEQRGDRKTTMIVRVKMKSGDEMSASINGWRLIGLDGPVEWVACTKERLCRYMERPIASGGMYFPDHPKVLTYVWSSDIEDRARWAAKQSRPLDTSPIVTGYSSADLLPATRHSVVEFKDYAVVSDIPNLLANEYALEQKVVACAKERRAKEDAKLAKLEAQILSGKPTRADLQTLDMLKRQSRNFLSPDNPEDRCRDELRMAAGRR